MGRRREYYLYKQKGSNNYTARSRRQGRSFTTSLDTGNEKIANARARKWVEELKAKSWGEFEPKLFSAAAKKFAAEHYREIKLKTAARYQTSVVHLISEFGNKKLADVTSGALYDFEQKRRGEGVQPGTIINDFRCLSAILNLAQVWELAPGVPWTDRNPVPAYLRLRKKALKAAESRTRYLSHEEEGRLLDAANSRWTMYLILAIETGLRKEEQFSLLRTDVNWQHNYIQVRKEVTKTMSRRIPLTERGAMVLRDLLQSRNSMFVCPREGNERFSPWSPHILDHLKKMCRRAGIKDFRWHDLRRTYGCRCLQDRRMSMKAVSECLGHSSVKVTEKAYAFLKVEHLQAEINETEHKVVPIRKKEVNTNA